MYCFKQHKNVLLFINMDKKKALFETVNPFKAILILAIPTIISQLIDVFYNLADTFFLGRTENPYMIASTGIAIGLFAIGIVISNLFGIGGGSLLARLLGINKKDNFKSISSFSFYCGIVVAIVYSLIVFLCMKPILYAMGASDATYEYCRQYTTVVVIFGVPVITSSNIIAHLLRNVGKSLHAGIGLSLGGLLNIALDPIFMFVAFPKGDEVKAAAFATLISSIVALIYLIVVLIISRKKTELSLNPAHFFKINKSELKDIFKVGIPSALLILLFIISQMITLSVMSQFGDLQVAAIGIVLKVEKIASAISVGLCQGMLPIVAYNYASKNNERMKKTIKETLIFGLISSSICSILFISLSSPIVSLFLVGNTGDVEKTISYGSYFLKLRFLIPIFMFLNYLSSFSMQAMDDGKRTFIHAIIRIIVIYIPLIFFCSHFWQETGLALSFEISEFISAIIGIIFLLFSIKRNNELIFKKE